MSRDRHRLVRRGRAAVALAIVATVALGMFFTPAEGRTTRRGVDTVLRNGFIYTVDAYNSVAQAIAIDNGVIKFVGSNQGVRRFIGYDTEVVDLEGRMVMPGIHEGTSTA